MTAEIISGSELAEIKRNQFKLDCEALKQKDIIPGLAVILVGDDQASKTYIRGKQRACEKVGIHSELTEFSADIAEDTLLEEIERLNQADHIDGILVQLPLPDHIDEHRVIHAISVDKDVDGFHPMNIGKMLVGEPCFLPCTPHGILQMVKSKNIPIDGKHVVVIGRSLIVGKPVGQLFLNEHATVTYCHSHTANMKAIAKQADILVSAVGKAQFVDQSYVKEGAVVIDVGMNRDEQGKLCGDVAFDDVKDVAAYITPVPKGVGPMTITMLLYNTIQSAKRSRLS